MTDPSPTMTIGTLARAAGVNIETVRFYQRKGLLRQPHKPYGGIRRYAEADLTRLRFIRSAQRLGFGLDDIAELLALDDGTECQRARAMAEGKLSEVRAKLADLVRIEAALARLVIECQHARGNMRCPLISTLHQDQPAAKS